MKYIIPFDPNIFIEQTQLILPYILYKQRDEVKKALGVVIIFIVLGIVFLLADHELNALFFSVSIFCVFNLYFKNEKYRDFKFEYLRQLRNEIERTDPLFDGIFEFRDECVRISNNNSCTWNNWNSYKGYKIVKSNLILFHKTEPNRIIVIDKAEVGANNFMQILEFVQGKLGKV